MIKNTVRRVNDVLHPNPRELVRKTLGYKPICVIYGRIPVSLGFVATSAAFVYGFGAPAWRIGANYLPPSLNATTAVLSGALGFIVGANIAVAGINLPEYLTPRLLRRRHVGRRRGNHVLHATQIVGWAAATGIGLLPLYAAPKTHGILVAAATQTTPDTPQRIDPLHRLMGPSP